MPLSNQQAPLIVSLWNGLNAFDKRPTTFAPQHQASPRGRFKATKKSWLTPSVVVTKRCFLGENAGPAQWPSANRYMEAIVWQLCRLHPTNTVEGGKRVLRWTIIQRAYRRIRDLILENPMVMCDTSIQLADINQTTLTQWYNARSKKAEQQVLEQGVRVPLPSITSAEPLPPAVQSPHALNVGDAPQHDFELKRNTAGTATVRSRLKQVPDDDSLMSRAARVKPILPKAEPVQDSLPVSYSTLWYRNKCMQETGVEVQVKKRKLGTTCGHKCDTQTILWSVVVPSEVYTDCRRLDF